MISDDNDDDSSTESSDAGSSGDADGTDSATTTDDDSVTETTSEGWFSRLAKSIVASALGLLIFVPGSIWLLWWNEGRAVDAIRALDQGKGQVVEAKADAVDAALNGRLVHLSGTAETGQPAKDDLFGVTAPSLLRVSRKVEMYQWKESSESSSTTSVGGTKKTTKKYTYSKEWSDTENDSSGFKKPDGHANPVMPIKSAIADSPDVHIGAWHLDRELLAKANDFKSLQPAAGNAIDGYKVEGNYLYHGEDFGAPQVGDLRVSFSSIAAQTFSVVTKDAAGTLSPFQTENGYTIALLQPGTLVSAQMFQEAKKQEGMLTWILRIVGFVVMLMGFTMLTGFIGTMASVIPPLGELADAGSFVFGILLALPITLLTIALAWLVHRPLIAAPLILVAIGFFVFVRRWRISGKRVAMPRSVPA